MKLMIASDLHGSEYYVNLLTLRMEEEQPDRLLLLGDLLYHGPRNDLPRGYDTKKTAALPEDALERVSGGHGKHAFPSEEDIKGLLDAANTVPEPIPTITHDHAE